MNKWTFYIQQELLLREIVGGIQSEPSIIKVQRKYPCRRRKLTENAAYIIYAFSTSVSNFMANPRQRRKARSSSHRPISHSRNAKRNMKKFARKSYAPCVISLNIHECFF